MESKFIIVSIVKSNKSENNVWSVAITGEEQPQGYCKSAYKAMRFAFLLKKRTGVSIDEKSLKDLSHEIAELKAKNAEAGNEKMAEGTEESSADSVQAQQPEPEAKAEQPKKQRKPRAKKNAEVANVIAFQ